MLPFGDPVMRGQNSQVLGWGQRGAGEQGNRGQGYRGGRGARGAGSRGAEGQGGEEGRGEGAIQRVWKPEWKRDNQYRGGRGKKGPEIKEKGQTGFLERIGSRSLEI